MKIDEAMRIIHPNTTAQALSAIVYYGGLAGRQIAVDKYAEACITVCEHIEQQQSEIKELRELLGLAVGSIYKIVMGDRADMCLSCSKFYNCQNKINKQVKCCLDYEWENSNQYHQMIMEDEDNA